MEQIYRRKTEVHNIKRRGINDSATCQYRILTRVGFCSGSPNILPIRKKEKNSPYRSRSPGSRRGGLNRDDGLVAHKQLIINSKEFLDQLQ